MATKMNPPMTETSPQKPQPTNEAAERLREQAMVIGQQGLQAAQVYGKTFADQMKNYIEQGREGIRVFCFVGGVAISLYSFMAVLNVFGILGSTLHYLVQVYQLLFGLMTCVLEADPAWLDKFDKLANAQAWVQEHMKVLTYLWGRGVFYLFQGSLAYLASSTFTLGFFAGAWMVLCGILCIAQHRGTSPKEIVDWCTGKFRQLTGKGPAPDNQAPLLT